MEVIDDRVGMCTDTILICTHSLTCEDRAVSCCEAEFLLEVIIDLIDLVWPS